MVGEQYYSHVFRKLPFPCLMLLPDAPDFTVINVSDAYLDLTNTVRNDMVGKGFFEVFPTNPYQSDAVWKNVFNDVIQKKSTCTSPPQKYAFLTKDVPARLDMKYLKVVNTPVLDDEGEIAYIIRSMTDVTDAIHHEKFLGETQRTAQIGSWEVNIARQTVTWSDSLREIYEVGPDFAPGFRALHKFHSDPVTQRALEDAFLKASKDGTAFQFTLPIVTAKGNDRWLSIVGKADLVNGTCIRIYGITRDVSDNKRLIDLDDLEKAVLEMSTQRDTPLSVILSHYILGIEALYRGMYCSILGVEDNRLTNWVAPSLPERYVAHVHHLPIGDNVGSCGTSAYRKTRIIVSDISTDPKWAAIRGPALEHGFRACWSQPIINSSGNVIAVLGIYYKQAKAPNLEELLIIDRAGALLNILIENRQNADHAHEVATMMAQGQELARFGNWQQDVRTRRHTWSSVLCDIYGIDPSVYAPSYDNYIALVHPADRPRIEKLTKRIFETGEDTVFEERIIRPDGEIRHLRSWVRLVFNGDRKPTKVIGASMDVTEAKRAELKMKQLHAQLEKQLKEVAQSEQKYSDLFHLSPQPMWVYDLETYRFLDVNEAAIRHYGYTRDEFLSMTVMDIRPPEEIPKLKAVVAESKLYKKLFFRGIFQHRKKNGEIIQVDIQSNIIQFQGRKAEVVLANDITLKRSHVEAIETQNKKLQEIAWMQSHVVRAPLARIMGLVDLIKMGSTSGIDKHQLLRAIYESATELDDVVGEITRKASQVNLT